MSYMRMHPVLALLLLAVQSTSTSGKQPAQPQVVGVERTSRIGACRLKEAAQDWRLAIGATEFKGIYSRGEGIVFEKRPSAEWEYMATGTGRTGVAVLTHNQLVLQINQEGCFDEHGWYKVAGRLHFEMDGDPFAAAAASGTFRMTHDLRRSKITISAQTPDGPVTLEIRGSMQRDVIQVVIRDSRPNPHPVKLRVQTPWGDWFGKDAITENGQAVPKDVLWSGTEHKQARDGAMLVWHNNGPKTDWRAINRASGVKDDSAFKDPLAERCFGFGILADKPLAWDDGCAELSAAKETVLYIAAEAAVGEGSFEKSIAQRFHRLPGVKKLVKEHEMWWRDYWSRVWFVSDESMKKHMVAYDTYRYFTAVSSGRDREFPVRFQIELLSPTLRYACWLQMHINSVQTVEAYFPMARNGDWDQLRPLIDYYKRMLPIYLSYSRDYYGHPGLTIPYEPNVWGSDFFSGPKTPEGDGWVLYDHATHPWSMYPFEHGIALMQMIEQAAEAKGDRSITKNVFIPYMREQLLFLKNHYPVENGVITLDPASSGETWYDVKNPASWIFALQAVLPRTIQLAREFKDPALEQSAAEILRALPSVARGRWTCPEKGPVVDRSCPPEESVFLPAEVFDRHLPINAENPELYGVWPYGVLDEGKGDYATALRTYRQRLWKNNLVGWELDVIWSARLGLLDETLKTYENTRFADSLRLAGGLSYEASPTFTEQPSLPLYPSMQGMGANICHLYEMICRDVDDGIVVLPAWPMDKPLCAALYSSNAGRVEIDYQPGGPVKVATQRDVPIRLPKQVD